MIGCAQHTPEHYMHGASHFYRCSICWRLSDERTVARRAIRGGRMNRDCICWDMGATGPGQRHNLCAAHYGTDHDHQWGARVDGLRRCRVEECKATDYDAQWGAGIFNDWPRGHSKPYGA